MEIDDLIIEYCKDPADEIFLTIMRKHSDAVHPVVINTLQGEEAKKMYDKLIPDSEVRNAKIHEYVRTIEKFMDINDGEFLDYQIRYLLDAGVFDYESILTTVPRHCGRSHMLDQIDKLNLMIDTSPHNLFVQEYNKVLTQLKDVKINKAMKDEGV